MSICIAFNERSITQEKIIFHKSKLMKVISIHEGDWVLDCYLKTKPILQYSLVALDNIHKDTKV